MCAGVRPPAVPGVDMPPAGNSAGIGPKPALNSTSRMIPSQNVGTDHNVIADPVETRSRRLPGRQPLWMPSHMPSTTETTVELPISSSVGHSRWAISVATGVWNCQE